MHGGWASDSGALVDDLAGAIGVLADGAGALDAEQLASLASGATRLRGAVDRLSLAISRRSDELHRSGAGLDAEDLWSREGGTSRADARRERRRAAAADETPNMGDAAAAGQVSAAHLDVVARLLHRLDRELAAAFRALDGEITEQARRLSVDDFEFWCRSRIERLGAELGRQRHERQVRDTKVRRWVDRITGMYHLSGAFHPDLGVRLFGALDDRTNEMHAKGVQLLAGDPLGPHPHLLDDREHLAAYALAHAVLGDVRASKPGRVEVSVLIDLRTLLDSYHDESLCEYGDGTPLPLDTVRRMACLGGLHRVLLGEQGEVLDAGRESRLANRGQRRALRALYRTCAWEGCDVPFHHCEIHHVVWWERDGLTDLANLLPLCVRHHHHAHELGWGLVLHADRSLTITRPDGSHYVTTQPPSLRPRGARAAPGRPPDARGRPPDVGKQWARAG